MTLLADHIQQHGLVAAQDAAAAAVQTAGSRYAKQGSRAFLKCVTVCVSQVFVV